MEIFRKGDFICLKNIDDYQIERYSGENVNIFEISDIELDFVKVLGCKNNIPFSDIDSIPINGKDDFQIYYDPIVCASIVGLSDPAPIRHKDYSYYFEAFKNSFYEDKNFQELVKERGLKYVHEVQHFLTDKFHDNGLKIHTF